MRIRIAVLALLAMGSGALAQDSGVSVIGGTGNPISLSRVDLYRALGDRIVEGRDAVGNNKLFWNQVNPVLPRTPIMVTLLDAADEGLLVGAIRDGCLIAGGASRPCNRVRLRRDRLDFDSMTWANATAQPGMARFEPGMMQPALLPAPSPPPAPAAVPSPEPSMSVSIPAYIRPVETVAIIEAAAPSARVNATRLFTGRESFPPESFAAYGIVAFSTLATSEDKAKYIAICEAFFSALLNADDVDAPKSAQMVTVWPVDDRRNPDLPDSLNTTRAEEDSCENAVEFYDIAIARGAIGEAMSTGIDLTGRGPFLLAWAPAAMKGTPDAVVLAADLSDVKTVADAKDVLRIWRDDIERDPALWQEGFSAEKLRIKLRQIVNRYGDGLLKFLGG